VKRAAALAAGACALVLAVACGSGNSVASRAPAAAPGATQINPQDFVRTVDNPWFPLRPGSRYRYRGEKDGIPAVDVMKVTHRVNPILGVPTTVVDDRVYERGKLAEKTLDYYTQDRKGNVWYFGEDTAELDRNGHVKSTEGTWRAGVDGAQPGIFMPPHPRVGQAFRQEFYAGHAEDHFKVVKRNASVKVPFITTSRALKTKEWTPLEPGVIDTKYYVRGIGTVYEATVKGGNEKSSLVSFKRR
jgi:hypothetical protein